MSEDWAKSLAAMSATELEHAAILQKMFGEYVKSRDEGSSEISDQLKVITKKYTEASIEVKNLHELFK